MNRICLGYTLIELMVVISIMVILFTLGIARYNQFNRQQIVDQAAAQLVSNLRLAQNKAMAGEKPIGCNGSLTGYKVVFDATGYSVSAVCSLNPQPTASRQDLAANLSINPPFNSVVFKVMVLGVETARTITIAGFGLSKIIDVTNTGDINIR